MSNYEKIMSIAKNAKNRNPQETAKILDKYFCGAYGLAEAIYLLQDVKEVA